MDVFRKRKGRAKVPMASSKWSKTGRLIPQPPPNRQQRILRTRLRLPEVEAEAAKGSVPEASKMATTKQGKKRTTASKPQRVADVQDEWEVEKIVDSVIEEGTYRHFYKIRWKGHTSKDDTWELKRELGNCQEAIKAYERKYAKK